MARVILESLSFGFSTPLLERVSGSFEPGWTGLVGENGSGKTTLLRLITGDLAPLEGSVRVVGAGPVVWCRQDGREQLDELRAFAADGSRSAQRWRGLLGVDAGQLEPFVQLSPGERKRWQLALSLSREPAVLLLDEPTNHLDGEARELVLGALRRFEGSGVLVSHDRSLLDALTLRTARLSGGKLDLQPGNYSQAQSAWQERREATARAKAGLKRAEARLSARADAQRRRAASAERDRGVARRAKGKHDHDARTLLAKNRAEAAGRRLARDAAALDSRLGRVQAELGALHVEAELGRELFADHVAWSKPVVLHVAFEALCVGGRRLLGPTSLDVRRGDKLALVAPNGSGKTTLLEEMERQNPRVFARSVVLAQSLSPAAHRSLGEQLRALGRVERGRVLGFVAALGSEPEAILRSESWSPGQARKVALALGLAQHAPALILDEPTNHLDLASIERLERLLQAFPGCVVLVSHDEALVQSVATRRCGIRDGRLVESLPGEAGARTAAGAER